MTKESRYTDTFNFLEGQILGIGEHYKFLCKVFNKEISLYELNETAFYYSRQLSWATKIVDQLSIIYNDVNDTTKKVIEMLYFEDNSFDSVIKKMGISKKRLVRQHNLIVDEMIELMGMDLYKKRKYTSDNRYIPINVRREVFERDEGKCSECGGEGRLHYHHIRRFSEGGTHSVNNLTLLCVHCHTEEHEGESAYGMLKSNIMR